MVINGTCKIKKTVKEAHLWGLGDNKRNWAVTSKKVFKYQLDGITFYVLWRRNWYKSLKGYFDIL